MIQCEYCGKWLKNKQALRAHLKACPLKPEKFKNLEFEIHGYRFRVTLSDKAYSVLKELGINNEYVFFGAVKAMKLLGVVKEFEVERIK